MAQQLPAYITPRKIPYFKLQVAKAFKALSPSEQRYAHHLNKAGWHGTAMCAAQCSAESPQLLQLFTELFKLNPIAELKAAAQTKSNVESDDFDKFAEYVALLYSNMGNYLSFGDSKFIPACSPQVIDGILAAAKGSEELAARWKAVQAVAYSITPGELALGFEPEGRTSYYSPGMTKDEVELVDAFLKEQRHEQWNTRVWKIADNHFEVRIPAAKTRTETRTAGADQKTRIDICYGDHAEHFARVVAELEKALQFAQTPEQKDMVSRYIDHFTTGDIDAHKESQKAWVKDKGPVVETNMGFIETYRDPQGVRAEWEGFVAVVDKEKSKMYGELVNRGPEFIAELPWGKAFEKESFSNPDFTSLEVLGFASAGIPLGICIPNYDDVRQTFGFKNVYLANTVSAINFDEKMNHLTDSDWALYKDHFFAAMSLNVGVHELLGHGTGKLLTENEDGTFNFDRNMVNPLTGKVVSSWYKPGETWGSVFQDLANPYEECRAEAVSLYLALNKEVQTIFQRPDAKAAADTVHVVWLNMVRGGLIGLEFYTPETCKWRQAHVRARYCILQTLLRCSNPLVTIVHKPEEDKLEITIDAERIATDGKAAIGELLRQLNINKATADVAAGKAFFDALTSVDEEFLSIRETVLRLRKPRKQFVQAHTRYNAAKDEVELLEFDGSAVGAIEAMVARHGDDVPL